MRTASACRPCALSAAVLCLLAAVSADPAGANPALEGYADYPTWETQVQELAKSDAVAAISLGKTLGGRDVYLLTVGLGEVEQKPALLVVGTVHEPHVVGAELAMRIARQLACSYADDEQVRQLLERYTFYIIPRPNPDGTQRLWSAPWRDRAGNDRPTDDDRDFQVGEDPPNDLDGDGWITTMRVEDQTGPYLPHPADPRILIQADAKKNERGVYRLYTEGTDEDGDRQWNEDAGDGVSLNRNFTFHYAYFQQGSGPQPVSERESRLIADFAFDHPNIALVFTFTPEDNLMHVWNSSSSKETARIPTEVLADDAPYFEFLANRYQQIYPVKGAPESPQSAGSFSRWAYYHYGRWSLGARAWWPPKLPDKNNGQDKDKSQNEEKNEEKNEGQEEDKGESEVEKPGDATDAIHTDAAQSSTAEADADPNQRDKAAKKPADDKRGADQLAGLRWLDQAAISGFAQWTAIQHPDFADKKVEVGGLRLLYLLNPPAKELDALAETHLRFLRELASLLPTLRIHSIKTEALGGGVYRITAEVANLGYLPTMSAMGRRSRQAYPLQISLELPVGVDILQGPAQAAGAAARQRRQQRAGVAGADPRRPGSSDRQTASVGPGCGRGGSEG